MFYIEIHSQRFGDVKEEYSNVNDLTEFLANMYRQLMPYCKCLIKSRRTK